MLVIVIQVPVDLRLHKEQCLSVQISEVDFFSSFFSFRVKKYSCNLLEYVSLY